MTPALGGSAWWGAGGTLKDQEDIFEELWSGWRVVG